jgi:hypothetical protein
MREEDEMKTWIKLTDERGGKVRKCVRAIAYFRKDGPYTNIVFGGTGSERIVVVVSETVDEIDAIVGGDLSPDYDTAASL